MRSHLTPDAKHAGEHGDDDGVGGDYEKDRIAPDIRVAERNDNIGSSEIQADEHSHHVPPRCMLVHTDNPSEPGTPGVLPNLDFLDARLEIRKRPGNGIRRISRVAEIVAVYLQR